jgi:hypothetical protein
MCAVVCRERGFENNLLCRFHFRYFRHFVLIDALEVL